MDSPHVPRTFINSTAPFRTVDTCFSSFPMKKQHTLSRDARYIFSCLHYNDFLNFYLSTELSSFLIFYLSTELSSISTVAVITGLTILLAHSAPSHRGLNTARSFTTYDLWLRPQLLYGLRPCLHPEKVISCHKQQRTAFS